MSDAVELDRRKRKLEENTQSRDRTQRLVRWYVRTGNLDAAEKLANQWLAKDRMDAGVLIHLAGIAELMFRLPALLSRNGILVLTGVPRGPQEICLDGNTLMAGLVRFNQTMTGTVNASRENFEMGLRYLRAFKERFPDAAHGIITGRYTLDNYKEAFRSKSSDEIKAVIEFE